MTVKPDSDAENPQDDGVSLDELAQAFAQVMGTTPKVKRAGQPRGEPGPDTPPASETTPTDAKPAEGPSPSSAEPAENDD